MQDRQTFTVPEGHEAVRDAEGRATGETQPKSLTLGSALDVAKASTGLTLQEAVNLGELNPAQARRIGERIDQIFTAFMRGAGVQWGAGGALKIVYPEVVNPILAAVAERKAQRDLANSTSLNQLADPVDHFQ